MSNARKLADLLDSTGDVKSGALDNVPASNNASALSTGTLPDGRFPATLPAASATNLTAIPAANITGTLPAISGASLTSVTATSVDLGNWTVTESAGVLYFATGSVNKMKVDASGNLTVVGNVTAYGSI
jgi:hypothetical protein